LAMFSHLIKPDPIFYNQSQNSQQDFFIKLAVATCRRGSNGNGTTVFKLKNLFQVVKEGGFPGCIGFVDGTNIPLSPKYPIDGNHYYDHKNSSDVTNSSVINNSETTLY
ncbi:hypothetical protein VP01_13952g1, partial [Puccinia sorghi]